jgi:hypothetical protein
MNKIISVFELSVGFWESVGFSFGDGFSSESMFTTDSDFKFKFRFLVPKHFIRSKPAQLPSLSERQRLGMHPGVDEASGRPCRLYTTRAPTAIAHTALCGQHSNEQ